VREKRKIYPAFVPPDNGYPGKTQVGGNSTVGKGLYETPMFPGKDCLNENGVKRDI